MSRAAKENFWPFFFSALLFLVFGTQAGLAAESGGRIEEVVVANSSDHLLLYFKVADAVSEEMERGLASGLPLVMSVYVELYSWSGGGAGRMIHRLERLSQLSYDNLKDHYRVEVVGGDGPVQNTSSLERARLLFSEISGLPLLPLSRLNGGGDYLLRIKARLEEKSRPWSLGSIWPFGSLWGSETPWHETRFSY